jgi:2-phospho-L-lactate guanylyltransferase (CobY/MobA/RfbA family)
MKPTDYILNWFREINEADQNLIAYEIVKGFPRFPRYDIHMPFDSNSTKFFENWLLEENDDPVVAVSKATITKALIKFYWVDETPTLGKLESRHEILKAKMAEMSLPAVDLPYASTNVVRSTDILNWQQLCENELSDEVLKNWELEEVLKKTKT